MRPIRMIGKVIGVMIVVTLVATLFGYVVERLWNWLIPGIFHGIGTITFWQAVGLLILTRLLFRGFGGGGPHRGWRHQGWNGPRRGRWGDWKHQGWNGWNHAGPWDEWRDKWSNMTPEERQKAKEEWRGNWRNMKNKWHDMSREERENLKSSLKNRCYGWMEGKPKDAPEAGPEKTESPEPKPNA